MNKVICEFAKKLKEGKISALISNPLWVQNLCSSIKKEDMDEMIQLETENHRIQENHFGKKCVCYNLLDIEECDHEQE